MAQTHYEVLQVEATVSAAEIRSAHRLLIRMYHPDRFDPGETPAEWAQANRMVARISEAYRVLGSPTLRAAYDAKLADATEGTERRERPSAEPGVVWNPPGRERSDEGRGARGFFDPPLQEPDPTGNRGMGRARSGTARGRISPRARGGAAGTPASPAAAAAAQARGLRRSSSASRAHAGRG